MRWSLTFCTPPTDHNLAAMNLTAARISQSQSTASGTECGARCHRIRIVRREGFDIKLYRSIRDSSWWFAFNPQVGWVMFPAVVCGWHERRRASNYDPLDMREVPLRMGFNTGIPGAPMSESHPPNFVSALPHRVKKRRVLSLGASAAI